LTGTAAADSSITDVSGSGTTYTVTVNTSGAEGTLGLSVATGEITDAYGNTYAGTVDSSQTYNIDRTAPVINTILRTSPASETTGADLVVFTITFDEPVTGVDVAQISLSGTAAANAIITE